MNLFDSIVLGFIQGLTEFLPISSSGHLVIFQNLLGFSEPQLLLDVTLHVGTLLAVVIYFKKDLLAMLSETIGLLRQRCPSNKLAHKNSAVKLLLWIIIACVPTGFIGLFFKHPLETMFSSVSTVSVMLLVTGAIIGSTHFIPAGYTSRKELGLVTALLVGTAQGLAIIPGISRSGTTIACGLLCGLDRELAGRFSFLISIPAIAGALLVQLHEQSITSVPLANLAAGFVTSATIGFLCLKILMAVVKRGRLAYFAPYCFFAGLMALVLF